MLVKILKKKKPLEMDQSQFIDAQRRVNSLKTRVISLEQRKMASK